MTVRRYAGSRAGIAVVTAVVVTAVFGTTRLDGGEAGGSYSLPAGTPVAIGQFAGASRAVLANLGATDDVRLIAERDGRAYYTITAVGGGRCFAFGPTSPRMIGGIECPRPGAETTPQALIDMSTAVLDPVTGRLVRVALLEGIAANEVASITIENDSGAHVPVPLTENVYRFDDVAVLANARAIVARNAEGDVVERRVIPR